MELLRDMALFVQVAEMKSFSRAAEALDMAASSLSQRISALEKTVGLRLLNRTTRKVEPTAEGVEYLERCRRIVDAARTAHEELGEQASTPRGLVRVSLPTFFGLAVLGPLLPEFARRCPEVRIDFDLSPRRADLVADGVDVAIRAGALPDSAMVARRICSLPRGLYAAPAYLAQAGRPAKPEALERHACIVGTGGARWLLARGGQQVEVAVRGRYSANNASMNRELALRGLGIAILPRRIVQAELRAGALREVLAPWSVPPTEISAVTSTRLLPARTRAFLDFLTEALAETPRP